jgi:hypothetical protein
MAIGNETEETTVKRATSKVREDNQWEIVTRAPKAGQRESTVVVDLHDRDLAEMQAWTSTSCVVDAARSTWIIGLQSNIRRMLEAGKSDQEIQAWVDNWKPDVVNRIPTDPVAATLSKFANMDAEGQAAFMAELQARLAAKEV